MGSAAPAPASIGLILSDDAELSRLNETHMGVAGPTDVLSFPLLPPAAFRRGAPAPATPRPPGTRIHLGDIVVSVERATEQAATGRGGQTGDVRWSAADELRLLVTHGVLHICGWDHASPKEEAAMRDVERRLLAVGTSRGVERQAVRVALGAGPAASRRPICSSRSSVSSRHRPVPTAASMSRWIEPAIRRACSPGRVSAIRRVRRSWGYGRTRT